eukprot:TRINITY_DN1682_c0_g1_i1.p1 TRINITY_DN1682_c0_g1~~TRINITY_DN1682_c0_g1_i1.p1  ORF type:complete len:812 (+),score=248.18 TRINITY_DN1682_c0_g1_i1:71-2437(+)
MPETIVRFVIHKTTENQVIKISGSAPSLGNWDRTKAVALVQKNNTEHEVFVPVDEGAVVEYKYFIEEKNSDSSNPVWWWCEGPNRVYCVEKAQEVNTVIDSWEVSPNGAELIEQDEYLEPYLPEIKKRLNLYIERKNEIVKQGGMDKFSRSYEDMGFSRKNIDGKDGIFFKEWAPSATSMSLVGEFNGWNERSHSCERDSFGFFTTFLADREDGSSIIPHNSQIKLCMTSGSGEKFYRIPAWIEYAVQDGKKPVYTGVYWCPEKPYQFKNERRGLPEGDSLKVYEAHVGMSSEEPCIASYDHFTEHVLPRVKAAGYNCVQLMAIMEHAYYASFGYHVTNFFASSSRFGTPDALKRLVDTAHGMGLLVIMDIVHSHASKNIEDGLNGFDGSDHHYFHSGPRGNHDLWDSRLFNYGNIEVLRFLLSNARFFIETFKFDGYRFDGVTSMLYLHHGMGTGFTGTYKEYFGGDTDLDSSVYLMLTNEMLHSLNPGVISIAEDVSGMPTLCRPVSEGGFGFDYRLGMATPDMWIKTLKEQKDEEWNMGHIVFNLTNRRYREKTITYAESHDQALVGDKTLAFWLMDKEMYTHMSILSERTATVDRGIALHKMIRMITMSLGGEGYLNFMGNEFGHPEWIDFPREGNNGSFQHCRRQWHLADDGLLRYPHLNKFDQGLLNLENRTHFLVATDTYVSLKHETDKLIVFEKSGLLFVFNFHPTKSFPDYIVGVNRSGKMKIVLDTDKLEYGGHNRLDMGSEYFTMDHPMDNREHSVQLYIPSRCAFVLAFDDDNRFF